MVFCSSCGKELPDGAYFCPECGVGTRIGAEAKMGGSWEEVREAFGRMGEELEKALETAGKEIEKAVQTVREEFKEAAGKEMVVCPECGTKNAAGGVFCFKCGKRLD